MPYGEKLDRMKDELESTVKNQKEEAVYDAINKVNKITAGRTFMMRVMRYLPEGWHFTLNAYGITLYAMEEHDAEEFRQVCRHVERVTGKPLTRYISTDYANNSPMLSAVTYVPIDNVSISVSVTQKKPVGCNIEWQAEVVPEHVRRTPKVPAACLGIQEA